MSPFIERPALPAAGTFAAGIWLGWRCSGLMPLVGWVCALAAVIAVVLLLWRLRVLQTRLIYVAICFLGAVLGVKDIDGQAIPVSDKPVSYEAVVASEPVLKADKLSFDIIVAGGPWQGKTLHATIRHDTLLRPQAHLAPLDGLLIYSRVWRPDNYKGSTFDYKLYALAHHISGNAYIYEDSWQPQAISLSGLPRIDRARLRLLRLRHDVTTCLQERGLTDQTLAIVSAMAFGDKSHLTKATRDTFAAVGVSHTLALSGMHLSLIYMMLLSCLRFNRYRNAKHIILLIAVWTYVLFVGMPLSAVRAAVMLSVVTFTHMTGRIAYQLASLALASIIILAISPMSLFDVGFQLSFISVGFIIAWCVPFQRRLPELLWPKRQSSQSQPLLTVKPKHSKLVRLLCQSGRDVRHWLWQMTSVCLIAQIATAPLIASFFGVLPVWFVPANIVAVPFVCVVIIGAVLLLTPASVVVLPLLTAAARFTDNCLLFIQSLPLATITVPHIGPTLILLTYAIIIATPYLLRSIVAARKEVLS